MERIIYALGSSASGDMEQGKQAFEKITQNNGYWH